MPRYPRIRPICEAFGTRSSHLAKEQWNAVASRLGLSKRQPKTVQAIIDGLHEDSIGARLGLSARTVHTHTIRLHRRLDVNERKNLVVRVFLAHLICEREERKAAEVVGWNAVLQRGPGVESTRHGKRGRRFSRKPEGGSRNTVHGCLYV